MHEVGTFTVQRDNSLLPITDCTKRYLWNINKAHCKMFQFCDNKTCFLALMLKVLAALFPSQQQHSLSLIEGNVGVLSQDPIRWEGSHRREFLGGDSPVFRRSGISERPAKLHDASEPLPSRLRRSVATKCIMWPVNTKMNLNHPNLKLLRQMVGVFFASTTHIFNLQYEFSQFWS